MQTISHWKVLALAVSAAALAAPEALARTDAATVAAIDPAVPLTPAVAPGAVAPDATPAVAVRRQTELAPPLRLARIGQSRSDAVAEAAMADFALPVPGALGLFATGLATLVLTRRRRPRRA